MYLLYAHVRTRDDRFCFSNVTLLLGRFPPRHRPNASLRQRDGTASHAVDELADVICGARNVLGLVGEGVGCLLEHLLCAATAMLLTSTKKPA